MRIGKYLVKLNRPKLAFAGTLVFLFAIGFTWLTIDVRSFANVQKGYQPSDIWIVDRNGYPLESVRTQNTMRSLDWVRWNDISPAFRELLVQVEDKRFYSHPGVDVLALSRAIWEKITGQSARGASTLPMQLVGLLHDGPNRNRRNFLRKFKQVALAIKLNSQWTKEEILEAYANLAPFRGELIGLRAASVGYFGKNPAGLTRQEAALLIALLRSPNSAPDLVAKRACGILNLANCETVQNLSAQSFSKPYNLPRQRELVPVLSKWFTENSTSPSIIQTSLEYRVQEMALRAMREQLQILKSKNVRDGAALVLETQSGRVVAYVANAGAGVASKEQIDGIQTQRQAGSTIKPFIYATAFDWQLLKANSLLEDSPADISVSQGRVYHPKNYDLTFRGLVSVGDALGSSMNVPAVRALQLVGERRVLERLRTLGFQHLQDDEYYGPSLALGAIDVTLWDLTQGYRQFALENSAFSNETRLSIFNILASPEYRRFTFGMDSALTLPFAAAVKTGTSKDMRDNWVVGWTPEFTVGVWVGNFNGEPMWNVSGVSGAAPVWRNLMLALHHNQKTIPTKYVPPSLPLPLRTISKIRYPAPDLLVGLDPDIPRSMQKLPIEIENPQLGHKIFLNQKFFAKAKETTLWPLERGKYCVELKSANDELIDSVNFEVR